MFDKKKDNTSYEEKNVSDVFRPAKGSAKVIIGNGGAEMGATRGYVTAYDVETGEQAWRFNIVPGNPADGFENNAMKMAAKTWTGEWWKYGGGGNVWNAMTYDPDFNHIYLGQSFRAMLQYPMENDLSLFCETAHTI